MTTSCLEPSVCEEGTVHEDDRFKITKQRIVHRGGTITFLTTRVPYYSTTENDMIAQVLEAPAERYYPVILQSVDQQGAFLKRSSLCVGTTVLALLFVVLGLASILLAAYGRMRGTHACGILCILCMIVGYPLAFCEARRYVPGKHHCYLMIMGWVFYAVGICCGVCVLVVSWTKADRELPLIYTLPFICCAVLGWAFMFIYMATCRRDQNAS